MKLRIYLDVEGQESLATKREVWPWQYCVRAEYKGTFNEPPAGAILLLEAEVSLPAVEQCIPNVMAALDKRSVEIQALAHTDLIGIKRRKQELLALTYQE